MRRHSIAAACLAAGALCAMSCAERPAPGGGDEGAAAVSGPDTPTPAGDAKVPVGPAAPKLGENDMARLLPEGTLAFVSLDDVTRARAEISKTALGAIWREEEVQAFVARPIAQLVRVMRQAEAAGGFAFADIEKAFGGQVAAALVSFDPPATRRGEPGVVAIAAARVTDGVAAGRLFDRVLELVRTEWRGPAAREVATPEWRGIALQLAPTAEATLAIGTDFAMAAVAPPGSSAVEDFMAACAEPPEGSLATTEEFLHVTGRLGAGRLATLFVATGRLRQSILTAVGVDSARDALLAWNVIEKLGLDGLQGLGASVAVDAPGIVQRAYYHAPAPRSGAMALVSGSEVSRETLALAPEGALSFSAASVKLSRVMGLVREVAEVAGGGRDLERALEEVRRSLGFDVEKDFFANLGDEAAFVIFPAEVSGGNPLMGGVGGISLVLTLKDSGAVGGVVDSVLAMADGLLQANEAGSVAEIEYLGTRIRYARIMGGMLAPSVAIAGDRLFITGGLHAAKELVSLSRKNSTPFIETDEVAAAFAKVGGTKGVAVSYADPVPAVLMGTAYTGMVAGMTLPALSAARERARRTKCMSNLKQIGYGCHLWAGDNDEVFPASLDALFPDYVSDREIFSCPSNPARRSYSYVSGLTAADPPDWVLAYEPAANHAGQGLNALYIAGQVMWTTDAAGLKRRVAEQIAEAKRRGRAVKVIEADAGAGGGLAAGAPGGEIDWGEFTDWVDLALMPSPRSYTRHLFPQVGRTVVDADGILSTSYGPGGAIGLPSTGTAGAAVVAAIAIPNLMQSRMASNESAAVAGCRAYLGAQSTFHRVDRYNRNELVYANPRDGAGFVDLFQIGGPGSVNEPLMLIDLAMARATGQQSPKAGYYFVDLTGDDVSGDDYDYAIECGLCAVPAQYGKSGRKTFVIDVTGTVYMKDTGGRPLTRYPDVTRDAWLAVGY